MGLEPNVSKSQMVLFNALRCPLLLLVCFVCQPGLGVWVPPCGPRRVLQDGKSLEAGEQVEWEQGPECSQSECPWLPLWPSQLPH